MGRAEGWHGGSQMDTVTSHIRHHEDAHTQRHRSSQLIQRRSAFKPLAAAALQSLPLQLHPFVSSHRAAVGGGVRGSSASLVAVAAVGSGGRAEGSPAAQRTQRCASRCSVAHSPGSLSAVFVVLTPLQRTHPAAGVDDCSGSCAGTTQCESHTHPTTTVSDPI